MAFAHRTLDLALDLETIALETIALETIAPNAQERVQLAEIQYQALSRQRNMALEGTTLSAEVYSHSVGKVIGPERRCWW